MWKFVIGDGFGKGSSLRINGEGEANVVVHPHPPKDEVEHPIPYRQYMTDTGASTGSNDMLVNGATTPQKFFVCPQRKDRDLYVSRVDVLIADASATLNKFGNITALINGVKLEWVTQEFGTVTVHEGLKSNFDFIRLAGGKPAYGDGAGAFRANNMFGTSEGYLPSIDFDEIFALKWGLRLRKNTTDCLVFTIQDDVSGIDAFNAIAYGIEF
jgi:hypothetical protein